MTKKKMVPLAAVVLAAALFAYWFYFSKPSEFPANEQAVAEINRTFPKAYSRTIQEAIRIDDRHMVLPFISKVKNYGLSYWVWRNHKWNVVSVDTNGKPSMWKIDPTDPSSYYLIWNLQPDHPLSSINFYLIGEREYHISGGIEDYQPKVQMKKKIFLQEKSYGAVQLPEQWTASINVLSQAESAQNPDVLTMDMFPEQSMFIGWIPYDKAGKESNIMFEGPSYSSSYEAIEELRPINESDMERP
ncbi:hypothetical protein J9317_03445 [Metabacillus sp. KIGAM252]|uniref:DUF4912 domain-containing protein n=1 Tax=Metabacillus flavus TaxID=2823519 RepID=A0ABS5LB16_9BACI|nr:hypothetical protein [Metabacillus flavus]MBS2967829.1 hypothetical protein [Metabacillus flavus]